MKSKKMHLFVMAVQYQLYQLQSATLMVNIFLLELPNYRLSNCYCILKNITDATFILINLEETDTSINVSFGLPEVSNTSFYPKETDCKKKKELLKELHTFIAEQL